MQIKDQIRFRREQLGLDMRQLARRVGVTEQAVRHWESGRSYPSKAKIRLVEEAMSFALDWSEGHNPVSEGRTAASMVEQSDVELLLVICQLPQRAKKLFDDLARMHLDVVNQARRVIPVESEELSAARAVAAGAVAAKTVARARATAAAPPPPPPAPARRR